MTGALAGRRAIVTGASRGIGRAIAATFAAEGARVLLVSRTGDTLAEVAQTIPGSRLLAIDVTSDGAGRDICAAALSEFGGIDILVNNAGGNHFQAPVSRMRESGWRQVMDLNLDSVVRLTTAALPALVASGNGSIVNVSSVAGIAPVPMMPHYGAAKAALISVTKSLAVEVAQQNVRVNALVPGWIETHLTDYLRTDDSVQTSLLAEVPMRRWGTADEIAQGALFLASDASSFMTGQTLVLDGGLTA